MISVCNIGKESGSVELIKKCKLIVWDEFTMSHKRTFKDFDKILQNVACCYFKHVTVIFMKTLQ